MHKNGKGAKMRTIIYYFTGTGNSLYIALQLGKKLGNCQIKCMANKPPIQPVGGPEENIGFVFPVYYFGMPRIVKQFVEKLDICKETYCFSVVNYGGFKLDTLGLLNDALQKKGVDLAYGYGIKMPGNFIVNYGPASLEKISKMIDIADIKIDEVAEAIAKKEVRPIKRLGTLISKWGNSSIYKNSEKFDEKFIATENCISCGLCSKVCPVRNITLEDKKPTWQHHCDKCMACIQWCPKEAIQYGQKTVKRKRYHNSNVTTNDIIEGYRATTDS